MSCANEVRGICAGNDIESVLLKKRNQFAPGGTVCREIRQKEAFRVSSQAGGLLSPML